MGRSLVALVPYAGGTWAVSWWRIYCNQQWPKQVAAASLAILSPNLHRAIRGALGVLPMRVGGVASQLDLPSLTPLTVAGCGRLQLIVPQWATSVDYCK